MGAGRWAGSPVGPIAGAQEPTSPKQNRIPQGSQHLSKEQWAAPGGTVGGRQETRYNPEDRDTVIGGFQRGVWLLGRVIRR